MELQTINQVSKIYGISTRMLRYYEKVGLIQSLRKDDYAYRVYDEATIHRLRQIITLRKLRVPVKQIIRILNDSDAMAALEIFRQNISEIDEEITALSAIRSILTRFAEKLREKSDIDLSINLLGDEAIFSVINSLSFSNNKIKEDLSMDELNKADKNLNKLEDKNVRITYLPPMTVAAAYASGEGCEGKANNMIKQFVEESGLLNIKPDARSFGFDCSQGETGIGESSHVYESWVSVPDDMDIPLPLIRRTFDGGLYAAHVLRAWDFDDWRLLGEWVNTNDKYDNDWNSPRWTSIETVSGQGFEETLNFYNFIQKGGDMQLDLLFPIKEKEKSNEQKEKSNGQKDLSDVCDYMKTIVVSEIPDDFIVAEPFRYGLSDAELNAGITAFRTFLYALYDKLAADKDKIDVETSRNYNPDTVDELVHVCCEGSIHECFPVFNDLAIILFNLGYHGKLETKQENKLVITCKDLLTPFGGKNEKYNSLIKMSGERKAEMFTILSELGFRFEGVDFSKEVDFSNIETFHVKHESNHFLPIGMKLLAEAQVIKKTPYYNLKAMFMRCDFYPLAAKKVKMKEVNFHQFLRPHSPELKDWLISIDEYLCNNGCKVDSEINNFNSNIIFTYTSRKASVKICKFSIGIEGCKAYPFGGHFANSDNILTYVPESMLDPLTDGRHPCTGCATKRPDLVEHNIRYTINDKPYRRCHGKGFCYPLDKAEEREIIDKWITMELEWANG